MKHRLEYAAVRALYLTVRLLPTSLVRAVGTLLGRAVYVFDGTHRRIADANLAAAGIRPLEFLRTRRAARALPADTLAHGDFQVGNLLYDRGAGIVRLTDFEYLGPAPWGTDLLHPWSTLEEAEDRARVLDAVLEGSGPEERARLGSLHRWLALRTLAEQLSGPRANRDPGSVERARRRAREAGEHAEAWIA